MNEVVTTGTSVGAESLQNQLVTVLKLRIGGRTSDAMMKTLVHLCQQAGDNPAQLGHYIEKVRTTMRLFVDEALAEVVRNSLLFVAQKHGVNLSQRSQ